MSRYRFVLAALALGLLAGCGSSGPKKVPVRGTVTVDGKALSQGEIYFVDPPSGKPPEILEVSDGKFEGKVTTGSKRVEVHALKNMGTPAGGMATGPELTINLVAEDYNVNSKLTAEVTEDGLNPSSFAVKANRSAKKQRKKRGQRTFALHRSANVRCPLFFRRSSRFSASAKTVWRR